MLAMHCGALRWCFALCVAMVLTLSLAAHGFAAAQMDSKMAAAAAGENSPSSGGCTDCGDGPDSPLGLDCYALCGGGTAAVTPSAAPLPVLATERPIPVSIGPVATFDGSPDPHPPRISVLN